MNHLMIPVFPETGNGKDKVIMCMISETHKVKEAASDFMKRVGVRLQELLHHGQEVSVHTPDLLQVGEEHLVREHMWIIQM